MSETAEVSAPVAAPAPVAPAPSGPLDTVNAAVAELERRTQARRAEKAEQAEAIAAKRQAAAEEMQRMEDERDGRAAPQAQAEEADEDMPEADASDDTYPDDDAEEATAEQDDDEPAVKAVKLDGEDIEIPKGTPRALVEKVQKLAADLKADYTRKTQEIATVRQTAAQRVQAAEAAMQQTAQAQQAILAVAQQWIGEPPPLTLAHADPSAYLFQKGLYEQRLQQLQAVAQQGKGLSEAQQRQAEQARQAALAEESQKMVERLPQLAKPEARREFLTRAVQAVESSGFTADDVSGITDHRMLHLIHRLVTAETKLAAMDKAGASAKTKLAAVPPRVLKPGVSTPPEQQRSDRAKKAKQDFMRGDRSMQSVRRLLDSGAL